MATDTRQPESTSRSVLVVDDDARVRQALRVLIQSSPGLAVCGEASSAPAALRADEASAADVVVLDLHMPTADDGLDVLRQLVARGRVVVVLSLGDALRANVLAAGAAAFIGKGADPDELLETLLRVPVSMSGTG